MISLRRLVVAGVLTLATPSADAGLWRPKEPSSKTKPAKAETKAKAVQKAKVPPKPKAATKAKAAPKARTALKAKWTPKAKLAAKEESVPVAGAKLAVFAFSGDDVGPVRRQVLALLRSKGLKINASLRPVDSPEQYREMAATLGLVAYVDGEVNGDGADGSATVHVRSGRTGLRIASATFSGDRRELPANVGRELWSRVGAALARACADAAKPRKNERAPMRINAGTPIADNPVENADE